MNNHPEKRAVGVRGSTSLLLREGAGSSPSTALQDLRVAPVPHRVAKEMLARGHYLGTLAAGTQLSFGAFAGTRLSGVITFGVGSANAHRLVRGAMPDDCLTLTRLWLADGLPKNSASRTLAVVLRGLRRHTSVRFVVTFADPAVGHRGTVYRASGFLYLGLSQATPVYDLGNGHLHHSRTLSHALGTRSKRYLEGKGIKVRLVEQAPKHRFIYLLDPQLRDWLAVPVVAYPQGGEIHGRA